VRNGGHGGEKLHGRVQRIGGWLVDQAGMIHTSHQREQRRCGRGRSALVVRGQEGLEGSGGPGGN